MNTNEVKSSDSVVNDITEEEANKMAEAFFEQQNAQADMYGEGEEVMTDGDWNQTFAGLNNEADEIEALIKGVEVEERALRARVPDMVVEHVFMASTINELVASPGAGKSTFTARLASCIADHETDDFLGFFRVTTGRVVVYSEDVTGFKNMLRAIDLAEGSSVLDRVMVSSNFPNLMGYTKHAETGIPQPSKALNAHIQALRTWAAGEPIPLVVFDTKAALMSSCVRPNGKAMEENSNDDQQAISNHALLFVKEFNAAGLFLSHPTKESGKGTGTMDSRGGGAAKGAMWKTFSLRKAKGGNTTLTPDKQRGNGFNCTLELNAKSMPTEIEEDIPRLLELYEKPFSIPADVLPKLPGMVSTPFSAYVMSNEADVKEESEEEKDDGRSKRKGTMMATPLQKEAYRVFIGHEMNGRMEVKAAANLLGSIIGIEYNTAKNLLKTLAKHGHLTVSTEGRGNDAMNIYTAATQSTNNPLLED